MSESPPPPVIVNDPVEIAPGIHVISDGRVPLVPNVGIVEGDHSVLVVDTGMSPASGAKVLGHAQEIAGDRPLVLTITHFHPEHGFGAQVFKGVAPIVYNAAQREELRQKGAGFIELFKSFGETVAKEIEDVVLTDPDIVYDGASAEIDLGGRTARLLTWGVAHTRSDQIVFLPEERVVFGGDLFETRMFPIVPWFPPDETDVDGSKWIEVLGAILEFDPAVVVPGHGEVTDAGLIRDVRDYLAWMREQTGRQKAGGADADAAAAAIEPLALERWSTWENPEWIGFAVRSFHARA